MPNADPKMLRRRWVTPAALMAAAVLALTSCGGDDGGATTDVVADGGVAADEPMTEGSTDPGDDDMAGEADDMAGEADEMDDDGEPGEDGKSDEDGEPGDDAPQLAAGTYRDYSETAVAEPAYETTVLFFYASWCPECRAFDQSITAGPIPDGVQILKTDYDTETELKQQYGITIQSTFVKVDADGEMLSSWVGYGKDRSIDTILTELE